MKSLLFMAIVSYLAVLAQAVLTSGRLAPRDATSLIPDSYIVVLKPSTDLEAHLEAVNQAHAESGSPLSGTQKSYEFGSFKGYSGKFSADIAETLKSHPDVEIVAQDSKVTTSDANFNRHCKTQWLNGTDGLWGLGRISHTEAPEPSSGLGWSEFIYSDECPAGETPTYAYIIDTGINLAHPEFEDRATFPFVVANDDGWTKEDNCGHGTHVAGTIAGKTYGISKKSHIVAVKALDGLNGYCSGSWSQIISAIEWTVKDILGQGREHRSIINMSIGGNYNSAVNAAVSAAVTVGVTIVVAAGNAGDVACDYTPASAAGVISVGSIDIGDNISWFSNYGCCVNMFAPGERIKSAYGNDTELLSGTSMASPHVAGVVLYNKCRRGYKRPDQDLKALNDHRYNVNGHVIGTLCSGAKGICNPDDTNDCAVNRLAYNRQCER